MKPLQVLNDINDTPGKNDKLKLLQDNSDNEQLADLLDATFNRSRKFFIKKLPDVIRCPNTGVDFHDQFMDLLADLESGKHRGDDATQMVKGILTVCSDDEFKWYSRVIKKDLKCGFSAKTAIKAGFIDIPLFQVMLAKNGKECKKIKEIMAKGVYASRKLDGYRCLAEIYDGDVTLFSREGIEYHNFPSIVKSLAERFPKGHYVFDGEIMSDDFQAMQKSAFANKRKTAVGDVRYHIFGWIPYDEWVSKEFKVKTKGRLAELKKLAKDFDENLILVEQKLIYTLEEILELEKEYLEQGYEGAMALPDIPYYLGKKSNKLLKFKTMKSQDCEIIGFYEGTIGTSNEGRLGGFIVKQENGLTCRGDGRITDADREYIWDNQSEFLGKIGEFKYQELTPDNKMRFPKFFRWRNDK